MLAASICMVVGAAAAALVYRGVWEISFYQSYMPDLVYSACGFGLAHPAEIPKSVADFLALKTVSLDCADLGGAGELQPKGYFTQVHLYLALAVSALWRMTAIRYSNLWPLIAALAGAYSAAGFVLFRLFFGRLAALVGGLVLGLSPVSLSMGYLLRDYAKGPFILWGIVLLILTQRARSRRSLFALASLGGATIGIGYGFRSDPILLLPIGIVFLAVGLEFEGWKTRAAAILLFVVSTLILASPMLQPQEKGGFGTIFMQGLSEPFRVALDLGPAPYTIGQRYSDELVFSSVTADLRPNDPEWDAREGRGPGAITQVLGRSTRYVGGWIAFFGADLATQALKSAAWIVGFPALVAPGRTGLDNGGWGRLRAPAANVLSGFYDALAQTWMPALCALGLVVFFWRLSAVNARETVAVSLLFAALLGYTVAQFAIRHVFCFEFFWIASLLALLHAPFEWRRLRSVALPFGAVFAAGLCVVVALRTGLAFYQDRALRSAFTELLGQPREAVKGSISQTDAASVFALPIPDRYRDVVDGPPDSMFNYSGTGVQWSARAAADRLLLVLGGPGCSPGKFDVSFHYQKRDGVWQPFDHALTVETPEDGSKRTFVLVPAFYRFSQHLSAIEVPRERSACLAGVERIVGPTRLPMILTAVLAPGWEDRSLHRAFGGFPVER